MLAMAVPASSIPQAVPVLGTDDHLPAVDAGTADAAGAAPALRAPPALAARDPRRRRLLAAQPGRRPSVLVPLVQRDDGLTVLLTRRTDHLRDHAGQISFPGGRAEADDADAVATALREAEEEVGLARAACRGASARCRTTPPCTDFVVTPVVALVQPAFTLALDRFEVAEAFEVPLSFLMTPAHHQRHAVELQGRARASSCRCRGTAPAPTARRAATSSGARPRRCCATCTASCSA